MRVFMMSSPEQNEKYCVYWIHLKNEIDPLTEGYVGVTNDIQRRWKRHKRQAAKRSDKRNGRPLYKAFRKYGVEAFCFEILADSIDKWSAYNLEYALRPHSYIGYNSAPGGFLRSSLLCSTLSPRRFETAGSKAIKMHINKAASHCCPDMEFEPQEHALSI